MFHSQTRNQIIKQNSIIKIYPQAFVNFKQNNVARFLSIGRFIYNNIKNLSTNYLIFELNCSYYLQLFLKKDINLYYYFKTTDKLVAKLQKLLAICYENVNSAQKLEKKFYNKGI